METGCVVSRRIRAHNLAAHPRCWRWCKDPLGSSCPLSCHRLPSHDARRRVGDQHPSAWLRRRSGICHRLLCRRRGVPLSASPRRIWVTKQCRRIRRKVWRKLKFVGRGPTKVRNHDYCQFSRREMRTTLVELLYNPNAAFRTYLRREAVEPLLNQHFSGKENWVRLVAALTVLEIAHKLWVAPSAPFAFSSDTPHSRVLLSG